MSEFGRREDYPFRRTDFAGLHLAICAALASGEALGFACSPYSAAWPVAAFATALIALVGFGWALRRWPVAAVVTLGFTLALRCESRRAEVFDRSDYGSGPFTADLPVLSIPTGSDEWLSFNSSFNDVDIRVICRCAGKPDDQGTDPASAGRVCVETVPQVGEVWRCSGWLERKERADRSRRALWVSGRGSSAKRVAAAPGGTLREWFAAIHTRLSAAAGIGLEHAPMAAALNRAILFGERANLPREVRQTFADAGTVHIFAISGLHIGIIAWMIVYLLTAVCWFPLRWAALPLAPLLGAYVAMVGSQPSAMRAAVMAVVYFAAPMFYRRSDSLVAWSLTFILFHLLEPSMLFNVGSALSFTVMLGILLYVRWCGAFGLVWPARWGAGAAAWAAGAPIAAAVFGRLAPWALAANLVLVPLAAGCVACGSLGAAAGCACPWLAAHLNNAAALITEAMTAVSWVAARLPGPEPAAWGLRPCIAWYGAILLAFRLAGAVLAAGSRTPTHLRLGRVF